MIAGLGARLCMLAGFVAGIVVHNQFAFASDVVAVASTILFPTIGAIAGYLFGRTFDPPKRDEAELVEETFE